MLDVLYEDNHLLAVNKPALLPTMGVAEGLPSLLANAKEYLRKKYAKPGEVYLGIVSRLDAPVTGVVLLARTSKAAARLTKLFRDRDVEKSYLALVEGRVEPASGQLIHFLRKDERHRRVHVTNEHAEGAQRAELSYRVLTSDKEITLVEVQLHTGRKHQIRVQLADAGIPVLGDRKYGAVRPFASGIALHARRLKLVHPVQKTPLAFVAPLPSAWHRWVDPNAVP
jgi:23S rRNA pseudouridine1911/1915/1917 synthase